MQTDKYPAGRLTRRKFALAGGAAAAGAIGAFAVRPTEAHAAEATQATETGEAAAVGGRFDLSVPSTQLIREKAAHNDTVLQSFAFDDAGGHLYTIQLMQGGIRLSGESAPVSGADRAARGDMCVTKLSLTGSELGHMYVRGFGHGVAIGCEPAGATAYLWTESDANPESGYGRAISRFAFKDGAVLDSGSSGLATHRPVAGSTSNQPAVDMLNKRLLLRYRQGGEARYRLMSLAGVTAGDYSAVYDIPQAGVEDGEVFQGFTVLGDYVYQLTGTAPRQRPCLVRRSAHRRAGPARPHRGRLLARLPRARGHGSAAHEPAQAVHGLRLRPDRPPQGERLLQATVNAY